MIKVKFLRIDEKGRFDFSKKDAYPKESMIENAPVVERTSRPLRKAED